MRAKITRKSAVISRQDTISIYDEDGREIAIRRGKVETLRELLGLIHAELELGATLEDASSTAPGMFVRTVE